MSSSISVLLVEDQNLYRTGIRAGIRWDQNISVAGEAINGEEALEKAESLNPDVILMDIGMPLMDGIECTKLIKKRNGNTKVIMLTSHDVDSVVRSSLSAGASGYCLKDIDSVSLCSAIKAVHRGEVWLDPGLAKDLSRFCLQETTDIVDYAPRMSESKQRTPGNLSDEKRTESIGRSECSQIMSRTQTVNIPNKVARIEGKHEPVSFEHFEQIPCIAVSEKFEYLGLLGQGGMSLVYKARHKLIDKIVAVKFLANHLSRLETFAARFNQEARISSQLCHPNIISVYDFGITPNADVFLVMEYVEGPTLADVLKRIGRMEENECLSIFRQLIDALSYAHSRDIVHRDIKPANVILAKNEDSETTVKLVDFGLAKPVSEKRLPSLTLNGEVVGSPIYMSPEQCQGFELDHRSDIYSLGCLFYEAICGFPPFRGSNSMETLRMHVQDEPVDPPAHLCSEKMRNILRKCLQKRPEDRYASACEIEMPIVASSIGALV